ncbi:hypothetical protein BGZ65_001243 [Modicella reniformis]|uniref:BTB domain-containing protein n=1 Tax=Modicella reniformis TaxID=1440133 RepID=A0A9P6INQ9_9FUNG|nr:hypothetical protein BGZ65_001243 [Modicella reniformis]
MDYRSEQNYGSTISFSVLCSDFSNMSINAPSKTIVRTFDRISVNLSQFGCWRCVFEETKRQHHSDIELHLSLSWIPSSDWSIHGSSMSQQSQAQELISRIKSVKILSDSTLSELLVKQLDGQSLLKGEFIKATPFLDLDDEFNPMEYRDEPPDIILQFLASKVLREDTTILVHSSALGESRYFTQKVTEAREEKARKGEPFSGLTCLIAEFTPAIFRVMLRYLYVGRLELKSRSKQAERKVIASSSPPLVSVKPRGASRLRREAGKENEEGCKHFKKWRSQQDTVYFEDLYRISERYDIPALKTLSLKAMQCTLNMSIAIGILANLPCEPREAARGLVGRSEEEKQFDKMQVGLALDNVKEYIHFFGLEATNLVKENRDAKVHLSVESRVELIQYIGDAILNNMSRLWEKPQ